MPDLFNSFFVLKITVKCLIIDQTYMSTMLQGHDNGCSMYMNLGDVFSIYLPL